MSRLMPEGAAASARRTLLSRMGRLRLGKPAVEHLFVGAQGCWHAGGTSWTAATDWLASHGRQRVRVVLGGAQLHHLCADASLPLADEAGVRAWAQHQFTHYHGPAAQSWSVAPWCVAGQRGASAVAQDTLQRLTRAASQHGVQLQAIVPAWAPALRAAGVREPALATAPAAVLWLVEGEVATRIELARGRLWRIDSRWLDAPRHDALHDVLAADEDDRREAQPPGAVVPTLQAVLGYGLHGTGALPPQVRVLSRLDADAPDGAWWTA